MNVSPTIAKSLRLREASKVAKALRAGAHFPELIVVAKSPEAVLTVFEAHVRLTAYMLAPACLPEELPVIVGFVPECAPKTA